MNTRRARFLLASAASIGFLIPPAWAATFTYPGAAPCDTTLQACVDGIAAGSIVEIAQNAQIAEFVTIDKSLTVRNASGFSPRVQGLLFAVHIHGVAVFGLEGVFHEDAQLPPCTAGSTIRRPS